MLKVLYILRIAATAICVSLLIGETAVCADKCDCVPLKSQSVKTGAMRVPGKIPVSVDFEEMLSSVLVSFDGDIGRVYIEICCLSSGGCVSASVDSAKGTQMIGCPISKGIYAVTLMLESGAVYYGEISI